MGAGPETRLIFASGLQRILNKRWAYSADVAWEPDAWQT
jgi:hypothetical protein